jgi:hypothetical protein
MKPPQKGSKMNLNETIKNTLTRWSREAQINFARHGKSGGSFERQQWDNGSLMVCPTGGLPNQAIPFNTAVKIYRDGWKVVVAG